jgi:hypothetical protein
MPRNLLEPRKDMEIRPATTKLIEDIEWFARQKFRYRKEIESLLEISRDKNQRQLLEDILFYAKFVSNAYTLLAREGMNADETNKLRVEFKSNTENVMTLIKTAIKEAPDDVKKSFSEKVLPRTQDGMTEFFALLKELAWCKNYSIDHNGLF